MRTRLIAVMLLAVSALLLACSPTADVAGLAEGAVGDAVSAPAAASEWAQAGDPVGAGRMILVAGTPEPGRGAGGAIKRPGSDQEDVFEFLSHRAWVTDDGGINIVGEVENVSDQVVNTLVSVAATLTDVNGDPVEGDFGSYLDRPSIAPGEVSSFWVAIWSDDLGDVSADEVADYELKLWVSETPQFEVELNVLSSEAEEDDGTFVISGEVENQTEMTLDVLFVYSTLYDAEGEVLNVTLDWSYPDEPLAPGDTAPFSAIFFEHFEDADSYYVFVTGYGTGLDSEAGQAALRLTSADGVLEFVSHAGYLSDYGGIGIVGEVENISDDSVDSMVQIEVQLFDVDGNGVLDPFMAYLDRPVLAPGEVSSFWIPVYEEELEDVAVEDISDYELSAWIGDRSAIGSELTVTEVEGSIEDDVFRILGAVLNESDETFDWLVAYSTLYDEDGNVLNTTADWLGLDEPLEPGDELEFEAYFPERFEDTDSFYVVVVGYSEQAISSYYDTPITLKAADGVLEVVSHYGFVSESGAISVVGEAENISELDITHTVMVEVRLFDADGEPVGDQVYTAVLDRPVIEPGWLSSFWVPIYEEQLGDASVDEVSDYEISLWITDEKSTEVEVLVDDLDSWEEDGSFVIAGTAYNQTELEFSALRVYSTLYDEDGEVLNATTDWVELDEPFGPEDEVPFQGYFLENFEDADSWYVFVTGYGAEPLDGGLAGGGEVFEVVSDSGFVTEYGDISVVGEAINVSDQTVDTMVVVEVRLFDEDGNEIGDGDFSAYLDRPVVEPGQTSSFWVPIYADDLGDYAVEDVAEYEVSFWVTDELSPDVDLTVEDFDGGVDDGIFYVWGTAINSTDFDIVALTVYSTLYDEDGNVLNATVDWIDLDEPLQPGDEVEFEGYFPERFEDADSFYVFVSGYPAEVLGR